MNFPCLKRECSAGQGFSSRSHEVLDSVQTPRQTFDHLSLSLAVTRAAAEPVCQRGFCVETVHEISLGFLYLLCLFLSSDLHHLTHCVLICSVLSVLLNRPGIHLVSCSTATSKTAKTVSISSSWGVSKQLALKVRSGHAENEPGALFLELSIPSECSLDVICVFLFLFFFYQRTIKGHFDAPRRTKYI